MPLRVRQEVQEVLRSQLSRPPTPDTDPRGPHRMDTVDQLRLRLFRPRAHIREGRSGPQRGIAQAHRIALQGRDPAGSVPVLLGVEAFGAWRNGADIAA